MKICSKCQQQRPDDEFAVNKKGKDGLRSQCKQCESAYHAEYRQTHAEHYREYRRRPDIKARRKEESRAITARIAAIKTERGCVDCGYNDHAEALDFDHLPGTEKLHTVSQMKVRRRWETIVAEIAKCEVVCANCHRVRTAARR